MQIDCVPMDTSRHHRAQLNSESGPDAVYFGSLEFGRVPLDTSRHIVDCHKIEWQR